MSLHNNAGFFLKTHDFLQPLAAEKPPEETSSGADAVSRPVGVVAAQHAAPLPGGVGTFSIRPAAAAVVKAEPPLVLWGQPTTTHPGGRGMPFSLSYDSPIARRRTRSVHDRVRRAHTHGCRVSAPGT